MTDSEKVSDSDGIVSDHPVVSDVETESTNTTGHGTEAAGTCPVIHGEQRQPHPTSGSANEKWWPNRLNLKILAKNPAVANPLGEDFDYAAAFRSLDLAAVKADIARAADHLPGLVAGRLRQLRPADDPDGLALRRHLPGRSTVAAAPAPVSSGSHR